MFCSGISEEETRRHVYLHCQTVSSEQQQRQLNELEASAPAVLAKEIVQSLLHIQGHCLLRHAR